MISSRPRVFVWATTKADATDRAHRMLTGEGVKVFKKDLTPRYIGVIDPGGYDYVGNELDGYVEAVGTTFYRYTVSYG